MMMPSRPPMTPGSYIPPHLPSTFRGSKHTGSSNDNDPNSGCFGVCVILMVMAAFVTGIVVLAAHC